jgi:hypothetical protein
MNNLGDLNNPQDGSDSIPKERFDEVNDRLLAAEARNDRLMEQVLSSQSSTPDTGEPEIEIDEDVAKLVDPIINQRMKELEGRVNPLLKENELTQQFQQLEDVMPGITDLLPNIRDKFNQLPQDQQALFDTPAGAVALAQMVKAEGTTGSGGDFAGRAHLEGRPGRAQSHGRNEGGIDPSFINSMTDEQFSEFMKAQNGSDEPSSYSEVDSLLD